MFYGTVTVHRSFALYRFLIRSANSLRLNFQEDSCVAISGIVQQNSLSDVSLRTERASPAQRCTSGLHVQTTVLYCGGILMYSTVTTIYSMYTVVAC